MKHLLIDENLPASIARILPVDSSHATDVAERPSDYQLWQHARCHGWNIDEAWPAKHGIAASLKGKSLQLDLSSEFRATVISLRRG